MRLRAEELVNPNQQTEVPLPDVHVELELEQTIDAQGRCNWMIVIEAKNTSIVIEHALPGGAH